MDDEQQSFFAMQQDWRYYSANHFSNRLPTIAPREHQVLHAAYHNFPLSTIADVPRTRLPPRSRSGCWTCRMRKVKCDEGRPRCNQCTRLNHECDYSPKLAFKNETPKVVDKYLGPNSPLDGWDPTLILGASRESVSGEESDELPAFRLLTNEEDWHRKAESRPPGTYFVVANSNSFADLEEYRAVSPTSPTKAFHHRSPSNTFVDDATVILGVFEEPFARQSWKPDTMSTRSGSSAPTDAAVRASQFPVLETSQSLQKTSSSGACYAQEDFEFSEHNLKQHHRLFIRRHLFRLPQDAVMAWIDSKDLFEQEAAYCPPLQHALKALSALSLACRKDYGRVHALEHYNRSLNSLKNLQSEQELASNGQFLTHFILLIYEISATEGFWAGHLEPLKRIMQQRREILSAEPFPSIVWWICLIDCSALLNRSGKGEFVLEKVNDHSIPTSANLRMTKPFLSNDLLPAEEWEVLAPTFDFLREIVIQAARIGELSGQIRDLFRTSPLPPTRVQIAQSQQKVSQAREILTQRWKKQLPTPLAAALGQQRLSGRARDAYEHASLTYNACIIYSHTSMWRTQRRDTEPSHYVSELASAVQNIFRLASDLISRQVLEQRFAVFALLMAGVAVNVEEDKKKTLELLKAFERESVGNNTRTTRTFLEEVYVRQGDSMKIRGHAMDVDWVEIGEFKGQRIIHFGL